MFTKILVPVDLSVKHQQALDIAARLASESGGEVTLVHVVEIVGELWDAEDRDFYVRIEGLARDHLAILGDPPETGRAWPLMHVNATTARVDHWHRSSLQGVHRRMWMRDDGAPALGVEFPRVLDNTFDESGCRKQDRPMYVRGVPLHTYNVLFPSPVPAFYWMAGREVAYFIWRGCNGDLHGRFI